MNAREKDQLARMKVKTLSDLHKFMDANRKIRLEIILSTPIDQLTHQQVDEFNGIVWWALSLLRMADANDIENAFTAEGLMFHRLMNAQAAILKLADWRGGQEDHSPPSKVISL